MNNATNLQHLRNAQLRLNGLRLDCLEQPDHPELVRINAAVEEIKSRLTPEELATLG
jgi:hypothetical protein